MITIDTVKRKKFLEEQVGIKVQQLGTGPYQEFGITSNGISLYISDFNTFLRASIEFYIFSEKNVICLYSDIIIKPEDYESYIQELIVPIYKEWLQFKSENKDEQLKLKKELYKKYIINLETTKIQYESYNFS